MYYKVTRYKNSAQAGLKEICLLFHVVPFPEWKFVKLLNRHAEDIEEGIRRKVALWRKAGQQLMWAKLHTLDVFKFHGNKTGLYYI